MYIVQYILTKCWLNIRQRQNKYLPSQTSMEDTENVQIYLSADVVLYKQAAWPDLLPTESDIYPTIYLQITNFCTAHLPT